MISLASLAQNYGVSTSDADYVRSDMGLVSL